LAYELWCFAEVPTHVLELKIRQGLRILKMMSRVVD